jgi:hypothetical protein
MTDEYIKGTCGWCGTETEIYRDTGRCEQCDIDIVHCSICDEDVHVDYRCRHVFKDDELDWTGSGAYTPSGHVKASFFLLLRRMPECFARDLRAAIRAGKFHTWMVAPIIGGGGSLYLRGVDGTVDYGARMIEIGEGERAEDCADGYRWLASLYDGDTPRANQMTIEWLDEWLGGAAA